MGSAKWIACVSLVCLLGVLSRGAAAENDFGDFSLSRSEWSSEYMSLDSGHFLDRKLLQVQPSSQTQLLAVRGDRRDPLDNFRKYRGGYDVTNKHYWASVVYTGIYGFAIGAAWLLLGALITLGACFKLCCCRRPKVAERRSRAYYWIPRILAFLLSLFAIGVIITMFVRNSQLHDRAFKVRDSIAASANDATSTVRNVSNTLSNVDTTVSKYNIEGLNSSTLSSTVRNLNQQADSIDNTVDNNVNTINKLINGIEITLIVLLSIALFLVVMGLLSALMGWRTIYFLIILLGWLIAALTWILFGIFFAANNVTSDTCQAFSEYLATPSNTTLDELLPCVDLATAASASNVVRQGVNNIVAQAERSLTQIEQTSAALGRPVTLPTVCDPIGPAPAFEYNSNCPNGTVTLGGLPGVVAPFVCAAEPVTQACLGAGQFVSRTNDTQIMDLSSAGQSLVTIIPTVTRLTNCSIVYNTFEDIVNNQCPPTKRALRNIWIPLLLLSIALTLLSLDWIFANHRNKKERYASGRDPEAYNNVPK